MNDSSLILFIRNYQFICIYMYIYIFTHILYFKLFMEIVNCHSMNDEHASNCVVIRDVL